MEKIKQYKIVTWKYALELWNNIHTAINEWRQPYWEIVKWPSWIWSKYDDYWQPMIK